MAISGIADVCGICDGHYEGVQDRRTGTRSTTAPGLLAADIPDQANDGPHFRLCVVNEIASVDGSLLIVSPSIRRVQDQAC